MSYLKIFFSIFLFQVCLISQKTFELVSPVDFGDRYTLESFSVSNGLYENNINDVLQDSYGFLWLAGMAGLQKYDGYSFKFYKPDSINSSWQEAVRLFEDSHRNLWVLMNEGLTRYQRESDTFVKYYFIGDKNDTIPYLVTAVAEDMKGEVWFWINEKGLFRVDHSKNSFVPYVKLNEMYVYDLSYFVRCMVFDMENSLWIGLQSKGLLMINPDKDISKKYLGNTDVSGSLSNNTVTASLRDQNRDLWFATRRGLNRFDTEKDSFERFFIDASNRWNTVNQIYRIADDGLGNIWTVTNTISLNVIGRFNKESKQFQYHSELDGANSVTVDRSGIIWFGKWYGGIYKLDPDAQKFTAFTIKEGDSDLLKDKGISGICKDKNGDIWIGAIPEGLYRFNPRTGNYKFYRLNQSEADSHDSNFILVIFQDSRGILWIGTKSGLVRFDIQTGHFKLINPANSVFAGFGRTFSIIEGDDGVLWLITNNGTLISFNPVSEETEYYSFPNKQMSFHTFVRDPRGWFWIGTAQEGLIKFDIASKKFSAVKEVTNKYFTSLCMESDSILWCATTGDGLIRYNTYTNTKSIINETDGLLSNGIIGMEGDNSGNLWLSSSRGLTCYNPHTQKFKSYFKEDGFLTNEFGFRGTFKDKNGEMIFGTMDGVVTFHPDSIRDSDYKPPLVLTDIEINNKPVKPGKGSPLKKNISISDKIILNHDQNDLSITFASLDFSHPERIEYSFYLQGLEEDWREPGLERTAYYTNLDHGEYVFKVKGTNSDGIWNEAGTSLKIIILPPWWETWWAYTIYGCFVFGLLYGLRRYELNRQDLKHSWELERVETEKYQEIDRMKSRFFANISHEFRTPLTLIKGPIQQMLFEDFSENVKKQFKMVLRNTNRLVQLINQLLDLSKLDSGEMVLRSSPEDIVPLANGLTQSFESLAKHKNIELQFQSTDEEVIAYIDRDKFEKIIINLLSNALKFTAEGGFVSVSIGHSLDRIFKDTEFSEIKISNSGEGISREQIDKIFDRFYQADDSTVRNYEGTGIGLSLTKELVELHHGKITVESEPGKVTTFTVYLPLGKNHLQPEEILETPDVNVSDKDTELVESTFIHESETSKTTQQPIKESSTLLIVEDNADMRNYMRESLESNYNIIEAENGEEGIQRSLEYSPDIIISDVMMPKMDGFQFCAEIKKDERTSHIPIILLTAKASGESKIEGLETGADDYLTKPFDSLELQIRIKNLIEQRRKLQEKFRKEFTVRPRDITVTSIDEQLIQRAIDAVEKNISDPYFDTTAMAKEVGASRTVLHTKLKALTGQSTGEFIRTLRLKRAAQLLQKGYGNVTQIAYDVGFQNLSYFAKTFREQFGQSPSNYTPKNVKDLNK